MNSGDFVESCTAIAERADGTFEILRWQAILAQAPEIAPAPEPAAA